MRNLLFIPVLALCALAPAHAKTFKCTENGRVSYQEAPCKEGTGAEIHVVPSEDASAVAASKGTVNDPAAITARFKAQSDKLGLEQRLRQIDSETSGLQTELDGYQASADKERADLQQKRDYWNTQPGGKLRANGIDDEIKSLNDKYNARIQDAQSKLSQLNKEKADIQKQLSSGDAPPGNEP